MGLLLQRLPFMATTGVGSLPFSRPADAATHVLEAYELPFCPQLPRAYGDMVTEWLGADPGRCGWSPDRDRQLPAVWDAFILALGRRPPAHRLVKLQVTGPVTLAMALEPGARDAELRGLAGEISTWLAATVATQTAELAELGFDAILMIDEPGLAAAGLRNIETAVWDPLRASAGTWGLHTCGPVPWELIDAAEPDLLSFDLGRSRVSPAARRTLMRLVSRGGRVMWGVFDAGAPQPVEAATRQIAAACASFGHELTSTRVLAASLVSASCGTGLVSIEDERAVAASAHAAAVLLRTGSRGPVPDAARTGVPEPARSLIKPLTAGERLPSSQRRSSAIASSSASARVCRP